MSDSSGAKDDSTIPCPACGGMAKLEPAFESGEAVCVTCRPLLLWFRDQHGPEIRLKTAFIADLGCDSLEVAELLMQLEDKFGIAVPDEEASKIETVGDAIAAIVRHLNDVAAG